MNIMQHATHATCNANTSSIAHNNRISSIVDDLIVNAYDAIDVRVKHARDAHLRNMRQSTHARRSIRASMRRMMRERVVSFNDARAIMRELIEHDAYMIAQRNDVQSRERDVRRVTMSRDALRYHACDIDTHTRYNDDIDNARLIDHIRNTR
jgi:hypothetical protein